MDARQSFTIDLMTMLLVLAGDHQASARANATALLRLAQTESSPEALYHAPRRAETLSSGSP